MAINAQIRSELISLVNVREAFEFLNIYKGIPLVYKATLLKIGEHQLIFKVDHPSAVCLLWEADITILEERNSVAISAQVAAFDITTGTVNLTNLAYTDRGFGVRTMVRVEPSEPIPVEITHGKQSIMGEMLDVSLTGFGLRTPTLGAQPLETRDEVRLAVKLMDRLVNPMGTIISITPEEKTYRLAVRFAVEVTIPVVIARFITHRRAEIHRELRSQFEVALEAAKK
jgi:hypothetical protein